MVYHVAEVGGLLDCDWRRRGESKTGNKICIEEEGHEGNHWVCDSERSNPHERTVCERLDDRWTSLYSLKNQILPCLIYPLAMSYRIEGRTAPLVRGEVVRFRNKISAAIFASLSMLRLEDRSLDSCWTIPCPARRGPVEHTVVKPNGKHNGYLASDTCTVVALYS